MKSNVKSCMTAGVAIVGAGVIATSLIAPPPDSRAVASHSQEVTLLANVQPANANAVFDDLLASFDPAAALRAFIEGTLLAFEQPGPAPYRPVTGPLDGVSRIGQGIIASGMRFGEAAVITPLRFAALPGAFFQGNGAQAISELMVNLVDGPLWVIDPALYALRDALPAPFGGPGGIVENFRNELWKGTQEINGFLADPAGAVRNFVDATLLAFTQPGPVPYTAVTGPFNALSRMGEGFIATGMRLVAVAILTPLRFVELAGAIAQGNGAQGLSNLITNLVDGPLWVADPALYGLRDALPAPFGGPNALVENFRNGIWGATEEINSAIRSILGLPVPNDVQEAPAVTPNAGVEALSGAPVGAVPNPQARMVNLPQEKTAPAATPQEAPATNEQETLPQDPKAEAPQEDPTPLAEQEAPQEDPTPVAEQEAPQEDPKVDTAAPVAENDEKKAPTRNVVRTSLNFSPPAHQNGGTVSVGASTDNDTADTTSPVSDTAPVTDTETGPDTAASSAPASSAPAGSPAASGDTAPSGSSDE